MIDVNDDGWSVCMMWSNLLVLVVYYIVGIVNCIVHI